MPDRCDALVVGGGPAGSTCARQLVRAGLDVMVLDKRQFPRDKVCAGWITPAVVHSLELDLAQYARQHVLQPVHGFRTGMLGGAEVETRYREPASFGIRRCEFDEYLLRRSGARLALGEPMSSMQRDGDGWLVNGHIRTPLIIGAGGHFCPVARTLGTQAGRSEMLVAAQEIEFRPSPQQRGAYAIAPDTAHLYFCPDLKGYGWCFPKGEFLNVGLGREDSHGLPEHVARFCEWLQERSTLPAGFGQKFSGHAYLLYPGSRRTLIADGMLLIGDAAGLAYPQSGEGIRPAVESALMAAQVIAAAGGDYRQARLSPYCALSLRRFGAKKSGAGWLPQKLRPKLAARLLSNRWFSRHVVIDRWFLHAGQPALTPG